MPFREHSQGSANIEVFVIFSPTSGDPISRGEYGIRDRFVEGDSLGHVARGKPDPWSKLENIGRSHHVAENLDRARAWMHQGRQNRQEGRLSRTIGTENDPPLGRVNSPGDIGKNCAGVANKIDGFEGCDGGHNCPHHTPPRAQSS